MSQSRSNDETRIWPLWVVMALVVAAWVATGWVLYPRQDRGTIRDMFGAVNALFSGLAFAGIIYTVWLQRMELQLQRKELRLRVRRWRDKSSSLPRKMRR